MGIPLVRVLRFPVAVPTPENLDGLTPAELKALLLKLFARVPWEAAATHGVAESAEHPNCQAGRRQLDPEQIKIP